MTHFSSLLLIRKYEMFFVTVFMVLCSLPINRSIKLMIDGTFDLGPRWNFEYKLKTLPSFEPKQRLPSNTEVQHVQYKSDEGPTSDDETQISDGVIKKNNSESIHGALQNGYVARTVLDGNEDSSKVDAQGEFEVTKLYKTVTRKREMIGHARKIEDDLNLMDFLGKIYNHSLQMVDEIRDKIKQEVILMQVNGLNKTYAVRFGAYLNETKKYYIKTSLGTKNVILNTIDYSDKIWKRLLNRFKSDLENSGLRSDDTIKILKESIDNLKSKGYAEACATFNICRTEKSFSDFIQELLTILTQGEDTKIKSAINALSKELKNADFSTIMDSKTQNVFRDRLTIWEELTPFELRVVIMAYIIIIKYRHHPFQNQNQEEPWIPPTVALYHVMEKFDEKFILIDNKSWSDKIKKSLENWINGKDKNISSIAKDLVHHVQTKVIANFDSEAAADVKEKLKLFVLSEKLQLNIVNFSYVPFQPFVR